MEDYRLSQTGQEVQDILNGAAMQVDLNTEVERATNAEGTLQDNIDAEEQARQDADGLLQQGIDDEAQRAKDAEESNAGEIDGIKALIPSTATSANKLADTNYVNSSIQTATAEYRGDYNVVTDLHLAIDATHEQIETLLPTVIAEADKNDYCYVMIPTNASTPTEIAKIERYKMTSEGWKFEYDVNNSTFTAEEWAAIKSGITSGLVAKLNALPTNADLLLLLAGKQDVLTFDSVPVPESNNPVKSGGVYSAIDDEKTARLNSDTAIHTELDGLQAKVPATASSDNKLVDQNQMNSSISTATATYRGDWNVVSDLHLATDATRAQIAALLPTVISTADNNDYCYVEIPTSAETPTQIERVERFKFNGTAWGYEYVLNNSGFTADQWAAINSMITSGLVAKLSALPTNADLLAMFATKQDNLTFDSTPTENSTNPVTSGGVFAADKALSDAIEAILLLIPSAASSLNKLVDTALMNSSISTATATFRGTYNLVSGLHLDIDATEGEIAAALLANISTADNNDYAFVQIPTSAETPAQIARTDRYKFNGTAWAFEYTLNTSGFTAAQWAAINSGVTDTLVAELANIANLIPSEASQYNKLADKVYVITQIIAHIADFKGEYGTLLELQSVLNPKPGDLGIVRTKDNDGKDVYTFYQYKDSLWNEYYTLSYHPQIKQATTGTTGDYPYNGMGRVELPMNMVNGVNTLTQDMFYKGAQGFREPNTNTIFVIRYDYVLDEDITVPANCVLEFNGGSISNGSVTANGVIISSSEYNIFKNITFTDKLTCKGVCPEWFGATGDGVADDSDAVQKAMSSAYIVEFGDRKKYYLTKTVTLPRFTSLFGNNSQLIIDGDFVGNSIGGSVPEYTILFIEPREPVQDQEKLINGRFIKDLRIKGVTTKNTIGAYLGAYDRSIIEQSSNVNYSVIVNMSNVYIDACYKGLLITDCWDSNFSNLEITGCTQSGISIEGQAINNFFTSCKIYGGLYTLYINYGTYGSGNVIHKPEGNTFSGGFIGYGTVGIYERQSLAFKFIGVVIDLNSDQGVCIIDGNDMVFEACYIWAGNNKLAINIPGVDTPNNNTNITFHACNISNSTTGYVVYVTSNENGIIFDSCNFEGSIHCENPQFVTLINNFFSAGSQIFFDTAYNYKVYALNNRFKRTSLPVTSNIQAGKNTAFLSPTSDGILATVQSGKFISPIFLDSVMNHQIQFLSLNTKVATILIDCGTYTDDDFGSYIIKKLYNGTIAVIKLYEKSANVIVNFSCYNDANGTHIVAQPLRGGYFYLEIQPMMYTIECTTPPYRDQKDITSDVTGGTITLTSATIVKTL